MKEVIHEENEVVSDSDDGYDFNNNYELEPIANEERKIRVFLEPPDFTSSS